jgi:hypothetical protein
VRGRIRDYAVGRDKNELTTWNCSCKARHVCIDLCRLSIGTLSRIVETTKGTGLRSTDDEGPIPSVDDAGVDLRSLWCEDSESVVGVYHSESYEENEEGEWIQIHGCEGALTVDINLEDNKVEGSGVAVMMFSCMGKFVIVC